MSSNMMNLVPNGYLPPSRRNKIVLPAKSDEDDLRGKLETPEMQRYLQSIADNLVRRLAGDFRLGAPRLQSTGGQAVDEWLNRHEERFVSLLAELIAEAGGNGTAQQQAERLRNAREFAELMLPKVLPELRVFALGRIALRWASRHYPDSVALGKPKADDNGMATVTVYTRQGNPVGTITIAPDGTVIESATTLLDELREGLAGAV